MARLKLEEVGILYKNFSGAASDFNEAGRRNFNVIIPSEMVDELRDAGWNIKERPPREEGDEPLFHTAINVNFDCQYPPIIHMYFANDMRRHMDLDEDSVGRLDRMRIVSADMVISERHWNDKRDGNKEKIKGYLSEMWVTVEDSSGGFGDKYAKYDYPEEDDCPFE